jgi:hypothetical protein
VLLWFDWARHDGVLVLPTIVAINCVLFAGRLLSLNLAYVSAENRAGNVSRGMGNRAAAHATVYDRRPNERYFGLIFVILLPWMPIPAISPFWPKTNA